MNVCSEGHAEIVYDSRHCPICERIEQKDSEINDLKIDIGKMEEVMDSLNNTIEEKDEKIKELEKRLRQITALKKFIGE